MFRLFIKKARTLGNMHCLVYQCRYIPPHTVDYLSGVQKKLERNYKSHKSSNGNGFPIPRSDWTNSVKPRVIGRRWPCLHYQLSRCRLANRLAVWATFTSLLGVKLTNSAATPSIPTCLCGVMPVHSREKKENSHEEMEVDFPEQDGSSTDEEDTVSSTVSEDGDSSGRKNRPLISTLIPTVPFLTWLFVQTVAIQDMPLLLKVSSYFVQGGGDIMWRNSEVDSGLKSRWHEGDGSQSCHVLMSVNRDGWWGLWKEEDGVSGWDDHPGETVHRPEGAVSSSQSD